jgi:hypothetical protein
MFDRRTALAAICLATAMLMIDIAVVNTALTHIVFPGQRARKGYTS